MIKRADDMPDEVVPSILGLGCKVPDGIRDEDDAIFGYLNELKKKVPSPFEGYKTRRVLSEAENLVDTLMEPAATEALETANVKPEEIDLLLGCASVSKYLVPSDLYELHRKLNLPKSALAVPLGNDFSNFNLALVLADALIRSRHADTILIAIGGNWSRAVDYHTVQAYSAGDGAAAAVVGFRPDKGDWQRWHVVDWEVLAASENFGMMYLADEMRTERPERLLLQLPGHIPIPWQLPGKPVNELWLGPCFHISPEGFSEFFSFGRDQAWKPVRSLLERHGISGEKTTLIAHQASKTLLDAWEKQIEPANFFRTIEHYANMTVANIPVNLALALLPQKSEERGRMNLKEVNTPYIVLLALGPDMHAHALLLGRTEASA